MPSENARWDIFTSPSFPALTAKRGEVRLIPWGAGGEGVRGNPVGALDRVHGPGGFAIDCAADLGR